MVFGSFGSSHAALRLGVVSRGRHAGVLLVLAQGGGDRGRGGSGGGDGGNDGGVGEEGGGARRRCGRGATSVALAASARCEDEHLKVAYACGVVPKVQSAGCRAAATLSFDKPVLPGHLEARRAAVRVIGEDVNLEELGGRGVGERAALLSRVPTLSTSMDTLAIDLPSMFRRT